MSLLWMALLAGVIAWMGWHWWALHLGHATVLLRLGEVFVPAILAGLVYLVLALALKIPAAHEMTAFALARFKRFK